VAVHHSSAAVRLCVFLRLAAVPDVHQMPWKAGCQPLSGPRQIRRPWMFHGGEKRGRRKLEAHADQLRGEVGFCLELPTLDWTLRLELAVLVLAPSARRIPVICKSRRHPSSQTWLPQVETSRFRRRPAELAFDRPHAPRSSKGHVLRCPVE